MSSTGTGVCADVMNEIPKVVFSETLTRADWAESRIGRRSRLFAALSEPLRLDVVEARTFPSGTMVQTRRPLGGDR